MNRYVTGNPTWRKDDTSPLETLKAARELIATEDTWMQGDVAINSDGEACSALDDVAVAWCALGALQRVSLNRKQFTTGIEALERTLGTLHPDGRPPVAAFNDDHTHAEVIELFYKAIEMEESRD